MISTLIALGKIFFLLSLISFGGGNTVLPEMQRQIVTVHHWITARAFNHLFALSQASPGPNMMIVSLLGFKIAGIAGLIVTSVAKFLPSSLIAFYFSRLWHRYKDHPKRVRFQQAMMPVTSGLIIAGAITITQTSMTSPLTSGIIVVSALLAVRNSLHPLVILLGGAIVSTIIMSMT